MNVSLCHNDTVATVSLNEAATVKELYDAAQSVLGLESDTFHLRLGESDLTDVNSTLGGTGIAGGDNVQVLPSQRFLALEKLKKVQIYSARSAYSKLEDWCDTGDITDDICDLIHLLPVSFPSQTFLEVASVSGNVPAARALIEGGAELDRYDEEGETPLTYAASRGLDGMIGFLLAHGADPKVNNTLHATTLHIGVVGGVSSDTCSALLDGGVDVNACTEDGRSAFQLALVHRADDLELMTLLLERGANTVDMPAVLAAAEDWEKLDALKDLVSKYPPAERA